MKTFEQFVNESYSINEGRAKEFNGYKVELSPAQLKPLIEPANKASVKSLANFSTKIGKETLKLEGFFSYNGNMFVALESICTGRKEFTGYWNSVHFQLVSEEGLNILGSIKITVGKGAPTISLYDGYKGSKELILTIPVDELKKQYYANDNDLIKAFETVFSDGIKSGEKEIQSIIDFNKAKLGAYVINIGTITISNGQTMFGWSIYDQPQSAVYLIGNRLFLATPDTFQIGQTVNFWLNDSRKPVSFAGGVVKDMAMCTQEEVIEMLWRNEYDYRPKKAFQKAKWSRKLDSSYSVKGTFYEAVERAAGYIK